MSIDAVLRVSDIGVGAIRSLFRHTGPLIEVVPDGHDIPGSHWGDAEAGLIGEVLYLRSDTPVHSVLHEGCHWLLMCPARRARLHTDAGGSQAEENAVCYLQLLLAERLAGVGRARMFEDMDSWGYSFRFGSARRWFETDAADASEYLARNHAALLAEWALD